MDRKRIIRRTSAAILIALAAFTAISNRIYQASLPRVRTRIVEQEVGALLDDRGLWENFAWIPRECVFPGSSQDTVCLYRVWTRAGQFTAEECYAAEIEVPVLDVRDDAVLVDELYLDFYETLICETTLPLSNGQTVVWLNRRQ